MAPMHNSKIDERPIKEPLRASAQLQMAKIEHKIKPPRAKDAQL
jgi:hypothetical protein